MSLSTFASENGCRIARQLEDFARNGRVFPDGGYVDFFNHSKCNFEAFSTKIINLEHLRGLIRVAAHIEVELKRYMSEDPSNQAYATLANELIAEIENEKLIEKLNRLLPSFGDQPGQYQFTERFSVLSVKGTDENSDRMTVDCLKREADNCVAFSLVRRKKMHEFVVYRFNADPKHIKKLKRVLRTEQKLKYKENATSTEVINSGLMLTYLTRGIAAPVAIPLIAVGIPIRGVEEVVYRFLKKKSRVLGKLLRGEDVQVKADFYDNFIFSWVFGHPIDEFDRLIKENRRSVLGVKYSNW